MIQPDDPYRSLMFITHRPPTVFVRGQGSWLEDDQGQRYLDFIQGWAVNSLGHCHPAVVEALCQQSQRLINPSPAFYNDQALRLAQLIVSHSCFDRVFFANSGAEANEGAFKLARKWGALHCNGAYEIITLHHSFHGRTLAAMSASGKPQWETLFEPKVPGFRKVDINDIDAVQRAINDHTVAVMLEPIQGEAGVIVAENSFLADLRELTRRRRLLLIVDEVQTGIGRTGRLFAYQHANIEPDIMTLGKGIGGGVPLAALVAKEEVCCFEAGDQGGTFNGNPLVAAVGAAVMETVLAAGFLAQVEQTGHYLMQQLQQLCQRHSFQLVRGRGLLVAVDLGHEIAAEVARLAFENHLLVNAPRPSVLRFMPALNVTHDEIDQMITILDDACQQSMALAS
ncbi:MAG: acetylornithine transaminase [Magnetococcales bacterium]|nr:acetylornithine transaminase [Magnetococcales bacterium]